jgi:Mg2+-importing ATPase
VKNLMDQAVLRFAGENSGFQPPYAYAKVDELPFDFIRRRLSVIVKDALGEHLLVSKGAVEEMLAIATHVEENGQRIRLDEARASNCWPAPARSTRTAFACCWSAPAKSRHRAQGSVQHR